MRDWCGQAVFEENGELRLNGKIRRSRLTCSMTGKHAKAVDEAQIPKGPAGRAQPITLARSADDGFFAAERGAKVDAAVRRNEVVQREISSPAYSRGICP